MDDDPLPRPLFGTKYRLLRRIGVGGYAEVFEAEHVELEHRVAVKLLLHRYGSDASVVHRLRQEARLMARLRTHPAIVPVHDFGKSDDGRAYVVMDLVAGRTLRQVIADRGGPLEIVEACGVAIALAEGLHVAHSAGIVHRDVKPENLMLTDGGQVKILDFGIAKALQESEISGTHTARGFVVGTPSYLAPEQALGRPTSAATDLYSLGVVLFEMIVGQRLFDGERRDVMQILRAHIETPPPSMSSRLGRNVPAALEDVVARLLRKAPEERYPTGAEVAEGLRRYLRASPAAAEGAATEARAAFSSPSHVTERTAIDPPRSAATVITTLEPTSAAFPTGAHPTLPGSSAPHDLLAAVATTERVQVVSAPAPQPSIVPARDPSARLPRASDPSGGPLSAASTTQPSNADGTRARRALARVLVASWILGLLAAAAFAWVFLTRRPGIRPTDPGSSGAASAIVVASAPTVSTVPVVAASTVPTTEALGPSVSAMPSAPSASVASVAKKPVVPTGTASLEYQQALDSFALGDYSTAEEHARKAGSGKSARLLLAQVLEREGRSGEAKAVFRQIIESDPANAAALAGLKRLGG